MCLFLSANTFICLYYTDGWWLDVKGDEFSFVFIFCSPYINTSSMRTVFCLWFKTFFCNLFPIVWFRLNIYFKLTNLYTDKRLSVNCMHMIQHWHKEEEYSTNEKLKNKNLTDSQSLFNNRQDNFGQKQKNKK